MLFSTWRRRPCREDSPFCPRLPRRGENFSIQKTFGEQRGAWNRSGCFGALASLVQRSIFNDNKSRATVCDRASPEEIYDSRRSSSLAAPALTVLLQLQWKTTVKVSSHRVHFILHLNWFDWVDPNYGHYSCSPSADKQRGGAFMHPSYNLQWSGDLRRVKNQKTVQTWITISFWALESVPLVCCVWSRSQINCMHCKSPRMMMHN